ncbi:MAG: ATP-binding protein, partial [Tepidisphaeraceae bacterium]
MMIQRPKLIYALRHGLEHFKAVALLGARQVGKTTLIDLFSRHASISRRFDLERPSDRAALGTPEQTLSALKGLVVIDEVQRIPELFEVLRPLCDRTPLPARFVLLGSASPSLVRGVSESLAGRCLYLHVPGFSMQEVGTERQSMLWARGGFPPAFLAADDATSMLWRRTMIDTFLERDMPLLGIRVPPVALRRFWMMLAHYHGQIWNASAIARSMDTGYKAVQHYRDILAGAFMIRVLPPWYENLGKRLVKSPKIYLRDSGLLHALLGLEALDSVRGHAIYGASWEGFALDQV